MSDSRQNSATCVDHGNLANGVGQTCHRRIVGLQENKWEGNNLFSSLSCGGQAISCESRANILRRSLHGQTGQNLLVYFEYGGHI